VRYYLVDESEEIVVDLLRTEKVNNDLYTFEFCHLDHNEVKQSQKYFVRLLAGKYYISENGKQWNKMAKVKVPQTILNVDKVFQLYRGYKPSGLTGPEEGELVSQMPGKVIKILVKEGDTIAKGDNVLVVEAMKMENEIKSNKDGVIKKIHVSEGQALDQGVLMVEIE
jgi:biotin carboxyl carrier protein